MLPFLDFWLFVLSRKDGHQSLVNVAQVFCEENIVSDLPNHPSCIDNRMTCKFELMSQTIYDEININDR